jgi:signal transduction histidine kinase
VRVIPKTLAGRTAGIIVVALVATQVVSCLTFFAVTLPFSAVASMDKEIAPELLIARVAANVRILDVATPIDRPGLAAALSDGRFELTLPAQPPAVEPSISPMHMYVRAHLHGALGDPDRDIRISEQKGPPFRVVATLPLKDGTWLSFSLSDLPTPGMKLAQAALLGVFIAAIVGLLSILTARRLSAPLAAFAQAAETLGVDRDGPPIVESGPSELRVAIRAFNGMQERLRRFIEDRTRMVAAMSHDLRTSLTRLRLRVEFIEDPEQQQKMMLDIEGMAAMVDATLALVRQAAQKEEARAVDLAELVASVCDDAIDANKNVVFEAGPRLDIFGRPHALRRAVDNIVDNAVKYGGAARVRLALRDTECAIEVDDDGPGIPHSEHERVFAPFYRIEPSRNRATGGTGLGLAVARSIARAHGGDIHLLNRPGGGLRVTVLLPSIPDFVKRPVMSDTGATLIGL